MAPDPFIEHYGYQRRAALAQVKRGWVHVIFHDAKGHYLPAPLIRLVTRDLERRGSRVRCWKRVSALALDLPGFALVNESWQAVYLGRLKVEFPCIDFGDFLQRLAALPPRVGARGQTYYKLHGWLHCIVLTAAHRQALIRAMQPQVVHAKQLADAETAASLRKIEGAAVAPAGSN
jgi:hypothetical protein